MDKSIAVYAVVILIALGSLYGGHRAIVSKEVAQAEQILKKDYSDKLEIAREEAEKITKQLSEDKDKSDKEKDDKIKTIDRKLASALLSLRNRDSRPINYSPNPKAVSSCTGRELYKEDGEFLAREASRADKVIIERDYYYEQYENIREKLNGPS